jgi:DNA/RNA-binding domain of Phe-tRNA-synthetase-like protein
MLVIAVDAHPLLDLHAFVTDFPAGLVQTPSAPVAMLSLDAVAPLRADDKVRDAVRRLLRHGGFKPSGRSKPASEYLVRAAGDGTLASINAAVDVCNIVSLHSGLPITAVDLAKAKEPFSVGIAPAEASYVFNASGQTIDLEGLLCLFDADGPCGNAVKDAQRTKTDAETRRTLTLMWGTNELPGHAAKAEKWYRELLHGLGAATETAKMEPAGDDCRAVEP